MYIIYGLINDENNIYYIGSTNDIKERINRHENTCFNQNLNLKVYNFIRENNLEINYIILEENISKENRFIKEREWIEKYDNLMNIQIPTRSYKEYREDNKEKIKQYRENNKEKAKEYYENNLEKIKEYLKEYYKNNKQKWIKNNPEKRKESYIKYRENNKEKIKEYQKNNREKRKEWESKPWQCPHCNKIITLQSKYYHLKLHDN